MFTDLTDFTKATSGMSRDQIEQYLSTHDRLVRPIIVSLRGKVIKTIGDSFLATFESPTDAVLAGVQIQEAVDEYNQIVNPENKIEIRVSINVGELSERDGDVFGDAVNVASRLLSVAEKNGVYFTEAVYLVMNKREVPTAEVGYRQFKGVPEKIKVFRVLRELPGRNSFLPKGEKPKVLAVEDEAPAPPPVRKKVPWLPLISIFLFTLTLVGAVVSIYLEMTQKVHPPPFAQPSAPASQASQPAAPPAGAAKPAAGKPAAKKTARAYAKPLAAAKVRAFARPAPARRKPAAKPDNPPQRRVAAAAPAQIEISSSPSGAAVYVDGQSKGFTDVAFPLSAGPHEVKLIKSGYQDKEAVLELKPGQRISESFDLEKRE